MSRGTHTGAAAWIRKLPETREAEIDAGCKAVLQRQWDYVDWSIERDVTGRECWPSAETIAEDIGSTLATVRDRLRKLTRAGWIRRDGRGWALAWARPFETRVVAKCDSGRSDSSRSKVRLESQESETPVTGDCDSSLTDHPMTIRSSEKKEGERAPKREALRGSTAPDPIVRLVSEHEASFTQAMSSPWLASMAEAVADLGLDVEQVRALLDAWQAERDRLKAGARGALLAAHRDGSLPEMREIWWARRRPWLLATLTGSSPPTPGESQLKPRKRGRFQDTTDYTPEAET